MRFGAWLEDRLRATVGFEGPWWLAISVMLASTLTVAVALVQRDAFRHPGWNLLLGVVIVASGWGPLMLRWSVPKLGCAALVYAAATGLMLTPVEYDFAPYIFLVNVVTAAAIMPAVHSGAVAAAGLAIVYLLDRQGRYEGARYWATSFPTAWVFGVAVRSQMRALQQERASGAARAAHAAAEERQRIAREVHDVIAHSLTVTLLHVTAARHVLQSAVLDQGQGDGPVPEAIDSLREAERCGRQAMSDIRRTVGLLYAADAADTDGTDPAARLALPGLEELPALVAEYRNAGLPVDARLDIAGGPVPATTALAVYRITQEALANVAKHAPGSATTVELAAGEDQLWLAIVNTAETRRPGHRRPGSGHGINGMRRRAELLGGTLDARPSATGWRVTARLPIAVPETADA